MAEQFVVTLDDYTNVAYDTGQGIDSVPPTRVLTPHGWMDRTREPTDRTWYVKDANGNWRFVSWLGPSYTPDGGNFDNYCDTWYNFEPVDTWVSGGLGVGGYKSWPFHVATGFKYAYLLTPNSTMDPIYTFKGNCVFSDPDASTGELSWYYHLPDFNTINSVICSIHIDGNYYQMTRGNTLISLSYSETLSGPYSPFLAVSSFLENGPGETATEAELNSTDTSLVRLYLDGFGAIFPSSYPPEVRGKEWPAVIAAPSPTLTQLKVQYWNTPAASPNKIEGRDAFMSTVAVGGGNPDETYTNTANWGKVRGGGFLKFQVGFDQPCKLRLKYLQTTVLVS
jgi:hypothetical protein